MRLVNKSEKAKVSESESDDSAAPKEVERDELKVERQVPGSESELQNGAAFVAVEIELRV